MEIGVVIILCSIAFVLGWMLGVFMKAFQYLNDKKTSIKEQINVLDIKIRSVIVDMQEVKKNIELVSEPIKEQKKIEDFKKKKQLERQKILEEQHKKEVKNLCCVDCGNKECMEMSGMNTKGFGKYLRICSGGLPREE